MASNGMWDNKCVILRDAYNLALPYLIDGTFRWDEYLIEWLDDKTQR